LKNVAHRQPALLPKPSASDVTGKLDVRAATTVLSLYPFDTTDAEAGLEV